MWAVRRASIPLRLQVITAATSSWGAVHPLLTRVASEGNGNIDDANALPELSLLNTSIASIWRRGLATQAESDNEASSEGSHKEPDLYSEVDQSDGEENRAYSSDPMVEAFEGEVDEDVDKLSSTTRPPPEIFPHILSIPVIQTKETLDQLIKEGKHINASIIRDTVYHLRRRRMFVRALEVFDWFAANENMKLSEVDYINHIDIVARVRGISKAEAHIKRNPEKFNNEMVYRTLLANAVRAGNVKKCEGIFNHMKTHFALSAFACSQMLLLYKRFDRSRIPEVISLMKKLDLKPTLFTYAVLVNAKGSAKDIAGMEELVAAMNADGVEPCGKFLTLIAFHYFNNGHQQKAEELLKQVEEKRVKGERWLGRKLLRIYADMGRVDEVSRLWRECESDATVGEYQSAISAWGGLGDVAKAEEVFNAMSGKFERIGAIHYISLLEVYASQKMVEKGKELMQRMADKGVRVGPGMVNAMVGLYVKAGELEKADVALSRFIWETNVRPRFHTFMTLMEAYASKGDVHNAEKVFRRMKQCAYSTSGRVFNMLLQAYANSGTPAYGIKERMIADKVYPSGVMAAHLNKVDPFKWASIPQFLN